MGREVTARWLYATGHTGYSTEVQTHADAQER
jgi:hypothetical protein